MTCVCVILSANDIAVLKLSEPVTYDFYVSPVCMPSQQSTLPAQCVVAGWGAIDGKFFVCPSLHFLLLLDPISYMGRVSDSLSVCICIFVFPVIPV